MKFSKQEIEAVEQMLPQMGAYVGDKGLGEKTFNTMSREEILGLFANTVREFRSSLADVIGEDAPF